MAQFAVLSSLVTRLEPQGVHVPEFVTIIYKYGKDCKPFFENSPDETAYEDACAFYLRPEKVNGSIVKGTRGAFSGETLAFRAKNERNLFPLLVSELSHLWMARFAPYPAVTI